MKCKSVPSKQSILPYQEKGGPGMHSRLSEDYEANGQVRDCGEFQLFG
jgi:hypothetical protein